MKNITNFCLKSLRFLVVKLSVYFNRHVFVMIIAGDNMQFEVLLLFITIFSA